MRTLYLLRHGQPVGAQERRCLGRRSDPPLSAEGLTAAQGLARAFSARNIRAVGSSPLLRCTQTAQALFPFKDIAVLPDMTELDCGDWDGLRFDDIWARWPEHYARRGLDPTLPPPNGEPLELAGARAEAALWAFLAQTEGDVVVVSHSGVLRALLCRLDGADFSKHRAIPQPYLCIDLLRCDGSRLLVDGVGLTALGKEADEI